MRGHRSHRVPDGVTGCGAPEPRTPEPRTPESRMRRARTPESRTPEPRMPRARTSEPRTHIRTSEPRMPRARTPEPRTHIRTSEPRMPRARTHRFDDRGTAILEFTGMLPILLFIGMAAIQLGIVGYTANQAGTAARAAARTEALEAGTGQAAGRDAVSGWLSPSVTVVGGDTVSATATIPVPSVLPGIHLFGPVHRTVVMPNDTTAVREAP
ncbi:TadE/TadG family type IV pilus assembly protein [Streptomyces sp. NBC_00859]|uniref:TadE/TadG family type IV pilus assembly protein n=1 Tax=Streptomyces sp. NBC_00859 TaxID=2903682 RepID=UPI003866580F|nr:pilus assembly protein [Streptomyces sp. NBC_00859]